MIGLCTRCSGLSSAYLVLVYGGTDPVHPKWVKVFGWTEQELVKRNLETILLRNPVNSSLIPLIEKEIRQNYQLKDWKKFDYIAVNPPTWTYIVSLIVTIAIQIGLMIWSDRLPTMNYDNFRVWPRE